MSLIIRGEFVANVPELPVLSDGVSSDSRRALPPPSNEYRASVAPSLRLLYSVIDVYSKVDWRSWDEEDRVDVIAQLQWCDEWLRWYRAEAPKLRADFADLLKRRNSDLSKS